jgi:hypothetical protein
VVFDCSGADSEVRLLVLLPGMCCLVHATLAMSRHMHQDEYSPRLSD